MGSVLCCSKVDEDLGFASNKRREKKVLYKETAEDLVTFCMIISYSKSGN